MAGAARFSRDLVHRLYSTPAQQSMTRAEAIAAHIAARIVRNRSKKHFGSLYADALQEIQMSEVRATQHGINKSGPLTNDGSMSPTAPEITNITAHRTDQKNLVTGEDTRQQSDAVQMPSNPAPRNETGTRGA